MKVFHLVGGQVVGQTATIKELREALAAYPDDMPVMAEWEGVWAFIDPKNFAVEPEVHKGFPEERCPCLMLDVNEY